MAVPFSRPAYQRRGHQGQQQHQQQRRRRANNLADQVEQIISGTLPNNLHNLSFRSRLVFYALYEAWRLLQELTNNANSQSANSNELDLDYDNDHDQPPSRHAPVPQSPPSAREGAKPDLINDLEKNTSAQSSSQSSSPSSSSSSSSSSWSPESSSAAFLPRVKTDLSSSQSSAMPKMPDVIPEDDRVGDGGGCSSIGGVGGRGDDDEEDKWWLSKQSGRKGGDWNNIGPRLCQVASAFEVAYFSETNNLASWAFNQMKRKLANTTRNKENAKGMKEKTSSSSPSSSTNSLAVGVARQVLLSGIWILLKQVM